MLDSTCVIYRSTSVTRDTAGGTVQVFTIISAGLPCSQQQASPNVQELYLQRNANVGATVYFDQDPATTANDYLVATDWLNQVPRYYLVHGNAFPAPRMTAGGEVWQADCELIQSPIGPPIVVNAEVSSITASGATLSAEATSDGNSELTALGFVISKTSVNDFPVIGGAGVTTLSVLVPDVGDYSVSATGLDSLTNYTATPYATNGFGTIYGVPIQFDTV